MTRIPRRAALALAGAAALPRFAIGQSDGRPVITVAVQKIANSNTLDPLREQSNVGTRMAIMVMENLISMNYQARLEQVPGLATAWRRIDDRTLEVELRPGVRFHNGDVMTADDVAFTFGPAHMFGATTPDAPGRTLALATQVTTARSKVLPAEVPPVARRLWPALERVEVVGPLTVRFVNSTPDVTLEGRLAGTGSQIISRRAFEAAASWLDFARAPVGTGPYKVRDYRPDGMLVLDAHDEYWGGRPPIRTLRLVEVPEISSRVNGLLSGEYQFACDIPPDQVAAIEANPAFEVQGSPITNIRLTTFDMHHPVLRDPRVRQAMGHAIDRRAIIDGLWAGRTQVPPGLQFDWYGKMLVEGWAAPPYDPARARQLLRDAGYKGDALPYRLLNNYYINQVPCSQVLVEMWRDVGLNVEIAMKENWSQVQERSGRGINDWSSSARFNDPVSGIVDQFGPQGEAQQVGYWTNAEMSGLALVMQTSTDFDTRKKAYARILQICERDDPAYTVLHQNAVFTGKRRDIRWRTAPSFTMDFRAGNWG
jgi:peptide/nickel transport system substrate-binding protein